MRARLILGGVAASLAFATADCGDFEIHCVDANNCLDGQVCVDGLCHDAPAGASSSSGVSSASAGGGSNAGGGGGSPASSSSAGGGPASSSSSGGGGGGGGCGTCTDPTPFCDGTKCVECLQNADCPLSFPCCSDGVCSLGVC